jgi:oxygen-independent coproporphyrinogen-3 oxidase
LPTKCPYCKFALTPIFDEAKKRRYLAHLQKEIQEYSEEWAETIYFWWGTPSVLSKQEIQNILSSFLSYWERTEVSFECNPEDIKEWYVKDLLSLGINRISLGIQSLNDSTLKTIHRSNKESILKALKIIENEWSQYTWSLSVNVDFILWLPYTTKWETLNNIQELHKRYSFITHTSVYMLEDGLYPKDWKSQTINDGEMEYEYNEICMYFDTLWWNHYEISNWAKKWYKCQHNLWYWNHVNYRGFGLSATSYIDEKRWENSASFYGYYKKEDSEKESIDEEKKELEKIIFAIRTFSLESKNFPDTILQELIEEKLIQIAWGKIMLTPAWIFKKILYWASLYRYATVAQR